MHWSDDDAFWDAMEPALCAPGRLCRAPEEVAGIAAALALPAGARVLDLGCGPGAHAIALAARGFVVTGVDRSARLLGRARRSAEAAGLEVEWVQADMREFRRPAAFGLVCSLYTSFGYFDAAGDRRVLGNVAASLAPGGRLVLDLDTAANIARRLRGSTAVIDEIRYEEHARLDEHGSMLLAHWTVDRGGVRQEFDVAQRLYGADELRTLLLAAGFADVRLFGSLDLGRGYDERAERLVAVSAVP